MEKNQSLLLSIRQYCKASGLIYVEGEAVVAFARLLHIDDADNQMYSMQKDLLYESSGNNETHNEKSDGKINELKKHEVDF